MIIQLKDKNDITLKQYACAILTEADFEHGVCNTIDKCLYDEMLKNVSIAGLAAPQIGLSAKAFMIKDFDKGRYYVFFNPRYIITPTSKVISSCEGCMSIPGKSFAVKRYTNIKLVFQDIDGIWYVIDNASQDIQVCFQHEFDHLMGKSLYDTGVETKWKP